MNAIVWPLLGGVLIGLSATLLLLSIGRIAGISGILWGGLSALFKPASDGKWFNVGWRCLFLLGLLLGTALLHFVSGRPYPGVSENVWLASVAGLLVGLGVKVGNGCTSGHGVCGLGRLSWRSAVATLTFVLVAILTVLLVNSLRAL